VTILYTQCFASLDSERRVIRRHSPAGDLVHCTQVRSTDALSRKLTV